MKSFVTTIFLTITFYIINLNVNSNKLSSIKINKYDILPLIENNFFMLKILLKYNLISLKTA